MRIGITGVTGLIGRKLAAAAAANGHFVTGFSRTAHASLPHCHNLRQFTLEQPVNLNGLDAVVHLAGEPVIGLWTREKRRRIVASRRDTTRHLVNGLRRADRGPKIFISASGTGFYGDRGAEKLDESSAVGRGFLAEVAQVWEAEARAAAEHGCRTCQLRTGLVLDADGGAFPLLRRVFSLGLGGKIGTGQQYLPWIHIDDVVALFLHVLQTEASQGGINAVAPGEVTNLTFTRVLGRKLGRPTFFGVPRFAIQTVLGDLSSIVLDSQRVIPRVAEASGFRFRYPHLEDAFTAMLSQK